MNGKVHIALTVSDLGKAVKFYQTFFGKAPHKLRDGYANFDLEEPQLKLALTEGRFAKTTGPLSHLGVVLGSREAVQKVRCRLKEQGLLKLDEGDTECCHAIQDKVWAQDPDGNAWEVYTILDDQLDDHTHEIKNEISSSSCSSSCAVTKIREVLSSCC